MDAFEFQALSTHALEVGFAGEIVTTTASATAQQLVALQAERFVRVSMTRSKLFGMIPDGNKRALRNPTFRLPRVSRSRPQTSASLGETAVCADANYFDVDFDERNVTPAPHEIGLKMSRRFTWDNVEREQIERTLEAECLEQFQEDIELSAIRGDTSGVNPAGYPPALLTTIDGYDTKLIAAANTYWADGAYIGEDLFQGMVNALPVERRPDGRVGVKQSGYEFFMPVNAADAWAERVSKRETNAGDLSLLEDGRPAWAGIAINGIPHFPTDLDGVAGHAVSNVADSFCHIWLLKPEQLFVYYNPVMFIHRGLDQPTGKIIYYYLYSAVDVQIDVPENCVIGRDVYPTRDTTAW